MVPVACAAPVVCKAPVASAVPAVNSTFRNWQSPVAREVLKIQYHMAKWYLMQQFCQMFYSSHLELVITFGKLYSIIIVIHSKTFFNHPVEHWGTGLFPFPVWIAGYLTDREPLKLRGVSRSTYMHKIQPLCIQPTEPIASESVDLPCPFKDFF